MSEFEDDLINLGGQLLPNTGKLEFYKFSRPGEHITGYVKDIRVSYHAEKDGTVKQSKYAILRQKDRVIALGLSAGLLDLEDCKGRIVIIRYKGELPMKGGRAPMKEYEIYVSETPVPSP